MFSRAKMKEAAKLNFKKNYSGSIGATVIAFLPSFILGILGSIFEGSNYAQFYSWDFSYIEESLLPLSLEYSALSLVIGLLFVPVLQVGYNKYFMKLRGDLGTTATEVFSPYKEGNWGNVIFVTIAVGFSIFLWSLLFVIPGIIKAFQYALVPQILASDSSISSTRAKQLSKMLMKNHWGELFVMYLSFLGWIIISSFTFGLLYVFYVQPYLQASIVEFYSCRRADLINEGKISPQELPSFGTDWYSPDNPNGPFQTTTYNSTNHFSGNFASPPPPAPPFQSPPLNQSFGTPTVNHESKSISENPAYELKEEITEQKHTDNIEVKEEATETEAETLNEEADIPENEDNL